MEVGTIVKSKAGRDKNKVYCVYKLVDKDFVELVNGDSRKLENPKRKRTKHLDILNSSDLRQKLEQGQKIYDSDIKTILNPYKKSFNGGNDA